MVMRRRARGVLVDLGAAAGREEGGLGPVGAGVLAVSVDVENRVLLVGCKGEESGVSESESKQEGGGERTSAPQAEVVHPSCEVALVLTRVAEPEHGARRPAALVRAPPRLDRRCWSRRRARRRTLDFRVRDEVGRDGARMVQLRRAVEGDARRRSARRGRRHVGGCGRRARGRRREELLGESAVSLALLLLLRIDLRGRRAARGASRGGGGRVRG